MRHIGAIAVVSAILAFEPSTLAQCPGTPDHTPPVPAPFGLGIVLTTTGPGGNFLQVGLPPDFSCFPTTNRIVAMTALMLGPSTEVQLFTAPPAAGPGAPTIEVIQGGTQSVFVLSGTTLNAAGLVCLPGLAEAHAVTNTSIGAVSSGVLTQHTLAGPPLSAAGIVSCDAACENTFTICVQTAATVECVGGGVPFVFTAPSPILTAPFSFTSGVMSGVLALTATDAHVISGGEVTTTALIGTFVAAVVAPGGVTVTTTAGPQTIPLPGTIIPFAPCAAPMPFAPAPVPYPVTIAYNLGPCSDTASAPAAWPPAGAACVTEACCFPDGSCEDLPVRCCSGSGGVPLGPGTRCGPNEACCLPSGFCIETDPRCCVMASGAALGAGTECGPNEACCLPSNLCITTDPRCCAFVNGAALGPGTVCGPNGACCLPDATCIETDQRCCAMANGQFFMGEECADELEACCLPDGTCRMLDPLCCGLNVPMNHLGFDGMPLGPGSVCRALGACCLPNGMCVPMDPQCCSLEVPMTHRGFDGVSSGSGTPCLAPEACCLRDGTCVMLDPQCCGSHLRPSHVGFSGGPQGPGSICLGDLDMDGIDDACCLCDQDRDGDVDVQDLLEYLALWFALDPDADLNNNGFVEINDLLRFLACWFPAVETGDC